MLRLRICGSFPKKLIKRVTNALCLRFRRRDRNVLLFSRRGLVQLEVVDHVHFRLERLLLCVFSFERVWIRNWGDVGVLRCVLLWECSTYARNAESMPEANPVSLFE